MKFDVRTIVSVLRQTKEETRDERLQSLVLAVVANWILKNEAAMSALASQISDLIGRNSVEKHLLGYIIASANNVGECCEYILRQAAKHTSRPCAIRFQHFLWK
jgi:hypothetical protein